MEVLCELLAQRYRRHSVMLTSKLVCWQWESIFADRMTAAATLDRVVHASESLELDSASRDTPDAQRSRCRAGVAHARRAGWLRTRRRGPVQHYLLV